MKLFLILSFIIISCNAISQNIGIGTNTPHANAILDVSSTNKGLLLPRLADTNAVTGTKPAGLTIYSNSDNKLYFYNGTKWQSSAASVANDSLWYLHNDSIVAANKKFVSINTNKNLPPMANLQASGSFLIQQENSISTTAPTAGQTITMDNNPGLQLSNGADSVVRIFDPGGTGSYNNNTQGNIQLNSFYLLSGYSIKFNSSDFGLGTGDTLWISAVAFPACRNDYLFRITNTTTAPAEFFIPNPGYQLFILFRANSDGSTGNGFDISIRKIYPVSAPVTDFGMAGNGLYFNPQLGSLQTGLLYYKNPGQYSFSAGISNASSLYAAAVGNSIASGASSFATGSSKASESYATALGFSQATGYASTALGTAAATNDYTVALGKNAVASGYGASAIGYDATASGMKSFAVGTSTAAGDYSMATGTSTATGLYATAQGASSAIANFSASFGFQNTAKGYSSIAMGSNTIANGFYSTVTGTFNDTLVSSNNASPASPLFTVGNGTDNNNRSNALVVLRNSFTGIGNVNPLAPLHIKTQGGEALRMDGPTPFLSLYDNGTLKGYLQALPSAFEIGSKSSMPLDFYTSDTRRMTILPNGNVGIGEPSPTAPLHITSNTVEALKIQGSSVAAAFYENTVQHGYIQSLASGLGVSSSAGQPLRLFSNQGSNERLTILANGNVGLNNSNPQTEFHVVSTGGEALRLDGPNAYQTFYNGNGYIGYLQAFNNVMSLASQGSNRLGLFSSGTERLTVMPAGNIGIDNTNPLYKLDIGGNVNFTGTINANGASGSAGQVLTSNGVAAPTWVNPTNSVYNTAVRKVNLTPTTTIPFVSITDIPNLTHTFTITENNLLVVNANINLKFPGCFGCGDGVVILYLIIDGVTVTKMTEDFRNDKSAIMQSSWFTAIGAGTHTVKYAISHHSAASGNPEVYGNGGGPLGGMINPTNMNLMLFKQ